MGKIQAGVFCVTAILVTAMLALALGSSTNATNYHLDCPRCETPDERKALVDCLERFRVSAPPEEDSYGVAVMQVEEACTKAVCPERPTVCTGHAICGQSYCHATVPRKE